jgi:hypothetical protein
VKSRSTLCFILVLLSTAVAAGAQVNYQTPAFSISLPNGFDTPVETLQKDYPKTIHYSYFASYNDSGAEISVQYSDAKANIDFNHAAGVAESEDGMIDADLGVSFDLSTTTVVRGYSTIGRLTARSAAVTYGTTKKGEIRSMYARSVITSNRIWSVHVWQTLGRGPGFTEAQANAILDSIKTN